MTAPDESLDYYALLLVSRTASASAIRASYRSLMQRQHPDHGGDAAAAALLNKAYAVLSDARRRAEYDALLRVSKISADVRDPLRACAFCNTVHGLGKLIAADASCRACDSPLCPAGQPRFERAGQRAVARFNKGQDIVFFTRWPQAPGFNGRSEDMSVTGMRFTTRTSLAVGQYIKIDSDVATAVALVTNTNRRRRGIRVGLVAGVAFVTLRFNQSLGRFVSETI